MVEELQIRFVGVEALVEFMNLRMRHIIHKLDSFVLERLYSLHKYKHNISGSVAAGHFLVLVVVAKVFLTNLN